MNQRDKLMIVLGMIVAVSLGLAENLWLMQQSDSPSESTSVIPSDAGAARPPAGFCDVLPDLAELDEPFIRNSSLYVRYVTPSYIVLVNILPRDCASGEEHCSYCTTATLAYNTDTRELESSDRSFADICSVYAGLDLLVHSGLPENRREDAVTLFVVSEAARVVVEISHEQICNVTHAFELERMFPLEVTVPPASDGVTI